MPKCVAPRVTTVDRIYLIVALFVAIIIGLVLYFQFQMDTAVGIRAFIGGEGLWAKAQKDAVLSLDNYGDYGNDADYQAYLRLIKVPLGYRAARQEIEKAQPDWDVVREACRQGGLHPVDTEYAIQFFRRFQRTEFLARALEHWRRGDQLIAELTEAAEQLHQEVAGGRARLAMIHTVASRLAGINGQLKAEEDQFSATLAEASRWANDLSRTLTYAAALLFVALGIVLSWSIIKRIRVTENALVAARQAAEDASLAKTRFLAAASHDLRQPLQAIGLLQETLARTGLNERQTKISHHLSTAVNSLGELLNKLLDISRLDADMIRAQPVVIQARDLIETIDAEFAALARKKNLRLDLVWPRQGLALFGDANLLLDLLRNLIGNAVKYTEQGGVLVSIRRRGDRALIQVWDTGIGIGAEHLHSIFDEYFQVGNPERHRAKGVGLGLAIVRRLGELLGTGVACRSRVGRGSVFEISLPLAHGSDDRASPVPAPATLPVDACSRFAGKQIVVVEDDPAAAAAIKLSLETHDIQVTLFATAEEALGNTAAMAADYYISDYRLPGMNGLDLLDAIQKSSAKPINAVLLTGDTSPQRIEQLARYSRWTVLFKPIDLPRLLSAMVP